MSFNKTYYGIQWIAISPVDSVIHPSNNPGLDGTAGVGGGGGGGVCL